MFHVPNKYRVRTGKFGSDDSIGNAGAFNVPLGTRYASVIASHNYGWEHVSVSFKDRCPTWDEMCKIKSLFWDAEDLVIQYHPPESEWINNHNFCLHLWRATSHVIPTPPSWMVGLRGARVQP